VAPFFACFGWSKSSQIANFPENQIYIDTKIFWAFQALENALPMASQIRKSNEAFVGKKRVCINFSALFQFRQLVFRPWSGQFWAKIKKQKSILFVSMRPIRNAIYDLRKSWMRARHFARRLQVFQKPIFYKNWRPAANKFKLKIPGPLLFLELCLEKYKNIKKIFFFSTQTTKLSIRTSALGRARRSRVAPGSMAFGHWTRLAAFGRFLFF